MSDEPSAWGVVRVGGGWVAILANEVQAETSRNSFDAMENWVHEVVPLYRSPSLTDEERAALWCAVCDYNSMTRTLDMPKCGKIGPALASLFGRLK